MQPGKEIFAMVISAAVELISYTILFTPLFNIHDNPIKQVLLLFPLYIEGEA